MKFRDGDELLSMSVIRAEQVAAEEARRARAPASRRGRRLPDVQEQYVFTITDGGFAKRTRISDYRLQSRGGIGIKAMKLATTTAAAWSARSSSSRATRCWPSSSPARSPAAPIDDNFRPTGRDTKGVKFVGVKEGDGVAVVARSVERAPEIDEAVEEAVEAAERGGSLR